MSDRYDLAVLVPFLTYQYIKIAENPCDLYMIPIWGMIIAQCLKLHHTIFFRL